MCQNKLRECLEKLWIFTSELNEYKMLYSNMDGARIVGEQYRFVQSIESVINSMLFTTRLTK